MTTAETIANLRRFFQDPTLMPSDPEVRRQMIAALQDVCEDFPFSDLEDMALDLAALTEAERFSATTALLGLVEKLELDLGEMNYFQTIKACAQAKATEEGEPAIVLLIEILKMEKTTVTAEEEPIINALLISQGMPTDTKTLMADLPRMPEGTRQEMLEILDGFWTEIESSENGFA